VRKRLLIAAVLSALTLLGTGVASSELSQNGNLRISFGGGFAPRSLPRDRFAPVRVGIEGTISTTDGSHPPALRRFEVALNRDGRLSTRGLPVCTGPALQSTTTEAALARCRPALVGHGSFKADLQATEATTPAHGTILVFNTRIGGRPGLLLHFYGTVPVRATFVLPLLIEHDSTGPFGTVLATRIETLAGGAGSITEIDLSIGREYTYHGRRYSFISASCAAPAGFPGAVFTFARGSFYFADGRQINTTLTRDCRVR
jgi:hypothetical protein